MNLLRVLDRAIPFDQPESGCLEPDQVSAACASHFKVDGSGTLSTYSVNDESGSEVAMAIAATRRSLSDVVWCLAPEDDVRATGVTVTPSPGETPYSLVNEMHVDLSGISLSHLTTLVIAFLRANRIEQVSAAVIAVDLIDAIAAGKILREKLPDGLLNSLDEFAKGKAFKRARRLKDAGEGG